MLAAFLSLVLLANVVNALFIHRFHRESAFTHFLYFASKQLKAMMYLFFQSLTHLPLVNLERLFP